MNKTAKVHSIETCGTVDGPGIRYVVFLQGCPLRCIYCHNPDTWDGGCKRARTVTLDYLLDDIGKYKSYFHHSGGGITLSGGEPLVQAPFALELFKAVKNNESNSLNTALDTSGFTELTATVKELLGHTDLVLLDIKSANPQTFKRLTGVTIDKTIAFAEYLNNQNIPAWIRYVVVPGFTDTEAEVNALATLIKPWNNVQKVEILPFHQLGQHKWEALKIPYELANTPTPSSDTIANIKRILKSHNLSVE